MATTFNVISLGKGPDLDTTEGNDHIENARAIVGRTFGSANDPLAGHIASFSPGQYGPERSGDTSVYDTDAVKAYETFRINGGGNQVYDSSVTYNATITYTDRTTAEITAVVFQDTNGNLYLAPEYAMNADQLALNAKPMTSLTLNSVAEAGISGMRADRYSFNEAPVCFTPGALVATPDGPRPVETLKAGDIVLTQDNGPQPIRWVGHSVMRSEGSLMPIRIEAGALGAGLPQRDVVVSPQHRVLVRSRIAERMFGQPEVLVAAKSLLGLPGISIDTDREEVTYIHLLLDRHEILDVEGAPFESLFLGPEARKTLRKEIGAIFPQLLREMAPARQIPPGRRQRRLASRHVENAVPVLD